ncbi:hypothetical protein [Schlesneria paludicola]|uniref:hypothetical protein n=1 Tax=Schlesneria paludicola TaxID=360056 RepID=UPI00029A258B|nr:hypothetical protein [Schlesneria paludicola]
MSLHPRIAAPQAQAQAQASAPANRPSAQVVIDSVVLHGLPLKRSDADRVRMALVSELSARWTVAELTRLEHRSQQLPEIRIRATDTPESIARALANALMEQESSQGGSR